MNYHWYDFVGNVGVALILFAYLAIQLGKIEAKQLSYSVLNLLGALFILISLIYAFNLSAVIIEAAWLIISLFGIFMYFRKNAEK
jgi:putative Ca2+/H+ antiporter (TMEM165/GDT1 family)